MAAVRRARIAAVLLAVALVPGACGGDAAPPLPDEFRRLEQREAGCIACHDGRSVAVLDPNVVATPSGHPSTEASRILGGLSDLDRRAIGL